MAVGARKPWWLVELSLIAMVIGIVYYMSTAAQPLVFQPLDYGSMQGALISSISAVLLVFGLSMLFFGLAAPIALFLEGSIIGHGLVCKTGCLFQARPTFDVAMIVPLVLAAYSAAVLGRAAWADYRGMGSLPIVLRHALLAFVLSLVLAAAIGAARVLV